MRTSLIGIPAAIILVAAGCQTDAPTSPLTLSPDVSVNIVRRNGTRRQTNDADLRLHPNGFGFMAYSAWKAREGLPDSRGGARQSLYFQKQALTSQFSAGLAVVRGVEGMPVSELVGLEWEHRTDGHCGAGAPRWNVTIVGQSGTRYTVFLGCAAAAHTPGSEPNWIRDTYGGPGAPSVAGVIAGSVGDDAADALGGTVSSLLIVFDEGRDQGPGFVFLDNVRVNTKTWTFAGDNGRR
jgi:hypothetical protein